MTSTRALRPLFGAALLTSLSNLAVALVAAPVKAVELGAEPYHLGLLGGILAASYLISAYLCGPLADRFGAFRLAWMGAVLMAAGILLWSVAPSLWWVIALGVLNTIGQGMFWPALEAWIAEFGAEGDLGKTVGSFNLSWSAGGATGALLAGPLCTLEVNYVFYLTAGLLVVVLGLLVYFKYHTEQRLAGGLEPGHAVPPEVPESIDSAVPSDLMLTLGRLSNFAAWFVLLGAFTLFPKFVDQENLTPVALSVLIFAGRLGLWPGFLMLRNSKRWHFNVNFARFALLLAGLVAVCLWLFSRHFLGIWPLAGFMFLLGLASSATYSESLFYSWNSTSGKGHSSGMHEMILGSSAFFAPLASGGLAQVTSIPFALLACGLVPLLVLAWFESALRSAGRH